MEEGYITSAVEYFWRVVEAGARKEIGRLGVLEEISRNTPEGAPDGSIADVADLALTEVRKNVDAQLQTKITETPLDVYPKVIGLLAPQTDYALEFYQHDYRTDGAFVGNMADFARQSRLCTVVKYLAAFGREDYGSAENELAFLRQNQDGASLVGVDTEEQLTKWGEELKAARKAKQEDETGRRRGMFGLLRW